MIAPGVDMVYMFLITPFVFLGHNIFERCHIRVNKLSDFFFFLIFGANIYINEHIQKIKKEL